MASTIQVHDPRGYPPQVRAKRLASRLENLDGKMIHLVDCLFDNSEVFMLQLQAWFAEHMPRVRTAIVKPRQSWVDDPDMRARIVREADGAVFAVGL